MVDDTKPRRKPKRRSGEQIVAAILNAAEELLVADGFEKLTTNAIARRAGVSVGSVYQYFPNKQAIVAGITHRLNEVIVQRIREVASSEQHARTRLAAAIGVICSTEVGNVALRRALLLQVPRSWEHTAIAASEQEVGALVAALVRELEPERSAEEVQDLTHALVFATRGAVQGALLYRPELLEDGRLTAILVEMFLSGR